MALGSNLLNSISYIQIIAPVQISSAENIELEKLAWKNMADV